MSGNSPVSLEHLASTISSNTAILTKFLNDNEHPQPTFSEDGPTDFPKDAPYEVAEARMELIIAARQMQSLAYWPSESLTFNRSMVCHDISSLQWLHHFSIPAEVPLKGQISYTELAEKTGLEEKRLTRVLRHAMTNYIFREPEPGYVAHTAESALIVQDKAVSGLVGQFTDEMFPAAAKLVEATEKFGHSRASNHAPFNLAFETDLDAMAFIGRDPVRSARFVECMKGITQSNAYSASHVADGHNWQALGRAVVVDVGGSSGHISKAIAAKAPHLHFIIQDQPEAIALAKAELEPELSTRFTFEAHDFFTPNPIEAGKADVFFMRFILHDWPAAEAIKILQNITTSMVPEKTRIIICDTVVPEPGEGSFLDERFARNLDMQMMTMINSGERNIAEWEELFSAVGLRILHRSKPIGSAMSLIEAVLVK